MMCFLKQFYVWRLASSSYGGGEVNENESSYFYMHLHPQASHDASENCKFSF